MLEGDLERLQDVGWTMTDASLCGLGQTAASAVLIRHQVVAGCFRGKVQVAECNSGRSR